METKEINSCMMLAINLDCPVSLKALFDEADLKDTGVELDSHITLLYARGVEIPRKGLMSDVQDILGIENYDDLMSRIHKSDEKNVFDYFDLGTFENDSDYLVLKLKPETQISSWLSDINAGLRKKYGVASDFADYTPHISLAELQPGTASKYLESETVKLVLRDTVVSLEDFMVSYGTANEVVDRKQYFLTGFHSVDRYFRLQHLRAE